MFPSLVCVCPQIVSPAKPQGLKHAHLPRTRRWGERGRPKTLWEAIARGERTKTGKDSEGYKRRGVAGRGEACQEERRLQKESWKSVQQRHGQTQHPLTDVNDRICNRRSPAPSPTDGHHQDEGENFHLRRRSRLCNDSSLRRAVPPRRMARRGQPESLRCRRGE